MEFPVSSPNFRGNLKGGGSLLRVLYRNKPWWLGVLCLEIYFQYHNGTKFFSRAFFPKGAPKEQEIAAEGEIRDTTHSPLQMSV